MRILYLLFTMFCFVRANTLLPPSDFLGYKLGDKFTPHHLVVDYLFHVSQNEPNVKILFLLTGGSTTSGKFDGLDIEFQIFGM